MKTKLMEKIDNQWIVRMTTLLGVALCLAVALSSCSMHKAANVGIEDSDITAGVNAGLEGDSALARYTIGVATDDGIVRLSGNVETAGERDDAEKLAAASRGVVKVDNYIQFGGTAIEVR